MADLRLPAGTIGDREVSNTDGNQINQAKLCHLTKYTERFGLAIGATPTTQEVILFQADKAGKLGDDISAALNDSGTSTSVSFDVKKNGTTVLSSAISVVHGTGDRTQVAGSFASTSAQAYAAGDVISCAVTASSTTGAQGPMLNYQRVEVGD